MLALPPGVRVLGQVAQMCKYPLPPPPHTHRNTPGTSPPPPPPPPPTPTPSVNKNNSEINKRVLTGKLQLSRVDEVLVCLNTSILPTLSADPLWSQLPLACLPSCSLEGAEEEEEEATWECAAPFKQRPYQPRAAWGRNVGVMRNSACCHQSEAESTQNRQLFVTCDCCWQEACGDENLTVRHALFGRCE